MASPVTLAQMVTEIRRRTNLERRFNFITDQELVGYINYLCSELYDLLAGVGGQEWFIKSGTVTTNSTDDTYPLPGDCYLVNVVEVEYSTDIRAVISPYMPRERAAYQATSGWGIGLPTFYRLEGKQSIRFIPKPGSAYTVHLQYYPIFEKLSAEYEDSQGLRIRTANSSFDGINGWEEWVIWKAVAYCEAKRKTDPSFALGRAEELKSRILSMALNRDMQNPERVQDVVGWDDWY